jgi:hypothetical protein
MQFKQLNSAFYTIKLKNRYFTKFFGFNNQVFLIEVFIFIIFILKISIFIYLLNMYIFVLCSIGLFFNNHLHYIELHHTTVCPSIKYYATLNEILSQNNTNITEK